jgi:uncharacterized membrane protein
MSCCFSAAGKADGMPDIAQFRENVQKAGGGICTKFYVITAIAILILAGLVVVTCLNIEIPAMLVKTFKDVPLIGAYILAFMGGSLIVLGIAGIREKKKDKPSLPDLKEPMALFSHISELEADRLLSDRPAQTYRIALVVGPIFVVLAVCTFVTLYMPQMAAFHLPSKVLIATALITVAIKTFHLAYSHERIIKEVGDEVERRAIQKTVDKLETALYYPLLRKVYESYSQIFRSLRNQAKLKLITQESHIERGNLLAESRERMQERLKRVFDNLRTVTTLEEFYNTKLFERSLLDVYLSENRAIAEAVTDDRELNLEDFQEMVAEWRRDIKSFKTETFAGIDSIEKELQNDSHAVKRWVKNYYKQLTKLYKVLPQNPDKGDRSLVELQNNIWGIEQLIAQSRELEEQEDHESDAFQLDRLVLYSALIPRLTDFEAALKLQLEKPHIEKLLAQEDSEQD